MLLVAVGNSDKAVEAKVRELEPNKLTSVLRVLGEEDVVCLL